MCGNVSCKFRRPMREGEFRKKIIWFTFGFSILVVWAHSFNAELFMGATEAGDELYRIEHFFGEILAQIAVPGFFMISGSLFYRNFSWGKLGGKWKSRIRSILIPYILWNSLYYLGYVIGSRLPGIGGLMGKGVIPFKLEVLADTVIHHTYLHVFWYLYQLIFLIALAPVLYGILKRAWIGWIYLAVLLVLVGVKQDLPVINEDALFYYSAAGFAALRQEKWMERAWSQRRMAVGILILAAAAGCFFAAEKTSEPFYAVQYRFLAVTGLWLTVKEDKLGQIRQWMEYNFFLYALHFAFVRLINKGGAFIFHQFFPATGGEEPALWPAGAIPLALYLMMPAAMVILSAWMGKTMKKISPAIFCLLNGGR